MLCMSRPRITADLPDEVRRGLLIAAAEQDVSIGDLIEGMARRLYPDHIKRAESLISGSEEHPTPRARKPRSPRKTS